VFHLVIMTLPLFVAWRYRLLGGADLKILVVLTLANPLLVVAAWIGVLLYFVGLLVIHRNHPFKLRRCARLPWAWAVHCRPGRIGSFSDWPLRKGGFTEPVNTHPPALSFPRSSPNTVPQERPTIKVVSQLVPHSQGV
jgi:hypothetical protein